MPTGAHPEPHPLRRTHCPGTDRPSYRTRAGSARVRLAFPGFLFHHRHTGQFKALFAFDVCLCRRHGVFASCRNRKSTLSTNPSPANSLAYFQWHESFCALDGLVKLRSRVPPPTRRQNLDSPQVFKSVVNCRTRGPSRFCLIHLPLLSLSVVELERHLLQVVPEETAVIKLAIDGVAQEAQTDELLIDVIQAWVEDSSSRLLPPSTRRDSDV